MLSLLPLLALNAVLTANARAATVTSLGALVPSGVSKNGVVVGVVVDETDDSSTPHAAMWSNGTLSLLPERSGTAESDAQAVSETGRVVGLEYNNGEVHAVYWDGVTLPTQIGPLAAGVDFSNASDVDFDGNVVGLTTLGTQPHYQVGFYAADGSGPFAVGAGNLDADKGSSKVGAISGDGALLLGAVAGTDSNDGYYLWSTATPNAPGVKLDLTPGTSGYGILGGSIFNTQLIQNDLATDGAVFGFKGSGQNKTWFLRAPNGTETQIVGLTAHNGINVHHVVVGTIATGNPSDPVHAASWDPDTQTVTDLNTLLPPNSSFLLFDALAINDNGDIVGLAAHANTQVGFLLSTNFEATITPDPPDPVITTTFTLTIKASNTLSTPITDVTPPPVLTLTGDGQATLESGPTPPTVATLAAGASTNFTYTYRATQKGSIVFTGTVQATGPQGALAAVARCGLGGNTFGLVAADATPTCPVSGNGTSVAISSCSITLATAEEDSGNSTISFDDLTLTKLAADSAPAHGSGYPPGGT